MNSRKEEIFQTIELHKQGLTAVDVAKILQIDRSNASRYLSELYKEKKIGKRLEYKLEHYDEHVLPTEERLRQRKANLVNQTL